MSTTLTATQTSKMQWPWLSKTTTLSRAVHVLVHFFAGTEPLRREIGEFDPHIDNLKNRRRLSLFSFPFVQFVELEYIYYEFNSRRVRLHFTEASFSLIFFLRFRQKKIRVFM